MLDETALGSAMENQEFVISCLNGEVLSFAKNIVSAAQRMNITRIIWLTGMGIHKEVPGLQGITVNILGRFMPNYVKAADAIVDCGIAYTLIRAPGITDGSGTEYHLTQEGEKPRKRTASKKAIAELIADMITDGNGLGENESLGITDI